ncbi:EH domain-containing protein 1 [Diplonema papillatum]|nr:EH domain-containing protein 1 [Diplonema papillatum]
MATSGRPVRLTAGPRMEDEAWDAHLKRVLSQLQMIYHKIILPVEEKFKYDTFRPSWFSETLVQTKPFVTFMGPFSAGKSTFINHLLESNYLWTGPQPTTDKFTIVMHGNEPQQVGGRVLANQQDLPFRGLNAFGDQFLEHLDGYQINHDILRSVTLIDTPGVLEAAGDIHSRRYDYIAVCRWFVERSDLVFVLFDPTKLDAGIELKMLFKHALKGQESKIRIVLNKSDSIGTQELMRVYGSLFWNLSNMINATEPPRVFVGSFWDKPYRPDTNHVLFTEEKSDLLYDLTETVPLQSLDKRVTSVLRRAKLVLVHALVCSMLKQGMPKFFGKDKAKKEAIANIAKIYQEVQLKFKFITPGDFGEETEYHAFFEKVDLLEMPRFERMEKEGHVAALKKIIEKDLPELLQPIRTQAQVDPRDKKQAQDMQQRYHDSMAKQLAGKKGHQGAIGEMGPSAWRKGVHDTDIGKELAYDPAKANQLGAVNKPAPKAEASPSPPPAAAASPAVDVTAMQQQMQMMMQMMQSMQPAAAPAAPAAPAVPAIMPPAGMDPALMQQMMAQMAAAQQMQQGSGNQDLGVD